MYKVYFKALKIKLFEAPYKSALSEKNIFNLNKEYFKKKITKVDIIFFTNPNQISDKDFTIREMNMMCKKYPKKLFFIDESYYDFGNYSYIQLTKKNKNLFVMRSITKTFGLASARIGFLIANKETIKSFKALETPYPISLFSGKCLEFFLKNIKLVREYNKKLKTGREYFVKELRKLNYKVHNSHGISIFIFFKKQNELKKKYNDLVKNYIYTREIRVNNLNFLRITSGPKKQMKKILKYF
jgi:histidinol-phosphate/aromatic aminotransferase/cobyric acid decarboxylase-like protein